MNKAECIIRLKEKMKVYCNRCARQSKVDIDFCFTECWVHIFTNLMIEEINGN